ncbi:MAG TPA: hypothetical protein VLA24_07860 [Pseudomonadales bacterium]|nr:hypothetical protein [Pseudomonadales bacterium]
MVRVLLAVCLALMVGCASQSPVKEVRPDVNFQEIDIGRARSVFLDVSEVDNPDLTSKGLLSSDFVLALELKREVRAALFNFGFTTAHDSNEADMVLRVAVDELTFVAGEDPVFTPVFLRNGISFVLQKGLVTHTFSYATQRTEKLGLAPSIDKGRELISEILSDTLQRAVQDSAFIAELSAE